MHGRRCRVINQEVSKSNIPAHPSALNQIRGNPGAGAGNFARGCEPVVEWVSDCIGYMRQNEFKHISATPEAEEAWTEYVAEASANLLRTKADSWFVGANIPGKARVLLGSPDSAPVARAKRAQVAANGYEGFLLR